MTSGDTDLTLSLLFLFMQTRNVPTFIHNIGEARGLDKVSKDHPETTMKDQPAGKYITEP
jgi:hypothetical protein